MISWLRLQILSLALILCASADERWAPHAVAGPVNQLNIAGNACGPAALLASFRCGDEKWRGVSEKIPGSSDRSKLLYIIKAHGVRPSATLRNQNRWTRKGINAEDLHDIACELAMIGQLRAPKSESLLLKKRESPEKLIRRVHDRLRDSLANGAPPVLSVRRYVFRGGSWQSLQAHFITIVMVPEKLQKGAREFKFTYFDPWGGKKLNGTFKIPDTPTLSVDGSTSTCIEAVVPSSIIGKDKVRSGEKSVVAPTFVTGSW